MKHINTVLVVCILILSTTLLIGNRFGFLWAGGEGYKSHTSGYANDVEYKRGETVSSKESWLELQFCQTDIWMDTNTEIKLLDGRLGTCSINIIQGRAVISGEITISTREVSTFVEGTTSFVHYSWLDKIEVANLDGQTTISTPNQNPLTLNQEAVQMTTLPDYNFDYIDFDPTTSSAADFYANSIEFGT